ncbi:hypothetical protein CYLTODRAFT_447171 [Cylindrobasidium torrendii FP15055 ss-10]|uniref:BCAS3 WD40 domain-containing protein n=1 Tax=Cylindrobasidium torrendii FP15055 ss-10 TaxID=1314674 RepID=A0A0D7AX96_9AGAR|nr:hypothetical protein CYLTODRAFT_447171 [Cylindrobasidium torrendii FP15055 ss-10]
MSLKPNNRTGRSKNAIYRNPNVSYEERPTQPTTVESQDGHTRSPVFTREPTMLESFSRTVRTYVPSSIPIPASAPLPPTVSRSVVTSTSQTPSTVFDDGLPSGLAQAINRSMTGADSIRWARWDTLHGRLLLILGYSTGLQVWDCANLGSVTEMLNLPDAPDAASFAAILPRHSALGIVSSVEPTLSVYSLLSHEIIKTIQLSTQAYTISATEQYIVISTIQPPSLEVLDANTFEHIHTVSTSALVPFADGAAPPTPVYAISGRLLAYASVPPPQIAALPSAATTKPIATTARTMISGMRTLGGLAFTAAVNHLAGEPTPSQTGSRFFSRSAPAGPSADDGSSVEQHTPSERGYYITVIDLRSTVPVSCFMASDQAQLTTLVFSPDGTSLLSATKDGQIAKVHRLRPAPFGASSPKDNTPLHVYDLRRGRTSAIVESVQWSSDGRWIAISSRKKTIHVFAVNPYGGPPDLESHIAGHVVNSPEMQPPSVEVSPIIRLRPTSQQQQQHQNPNGPPPVPQTFRFLDTLPQTLPTSLLPANSPPTSLMAVPSSSPSSPGSPNFTRTSSHQTIKNFQDMVVFDPMDGMLQLRRWVLNVNQRGGNREGISIPGMTSVSLPMGLGIGGRSSTSPRDRSRRISSSSLSPDLAALTIEDKLDGELVAVKDTVVATWDLRRRRDWPAVMKSAEAAPEYKAGDDGSFLSRAELQTGSKSLKLIPRSIYLSHQFSFHTLGEDYHALIRRYRFDVVGAKIEVRKEVQVSGAGTGAGERFVEGSPVSRRFDEPLASALMQADAFPDRARVGTVLPMLPNGHGRSGHARMASIPIRGVSEGLGRLKREMGKRRTSRTSHHEPSGMSMSVPLEFDEDDDDFLGAQDASGGHGGSDDTGTSTSTPATSLFGNDVGDEQALGGEPVSDDVWMDGWGIEDKKAVEDMEVYDDISAVGLMDEEQEEIDRRAMDRRVQEEMRRAEVAREDRKRVERQFSDMHSPAYDASVAEYEVPVADYESHNDLLVDVAPPSPRPMRGKKGKRAARKAII